MVSEILLHVGMHKTGTTALQSALSGYDDGRIRYARLGHANHSIPFVTCFASEPHRYHVWQRIGASRDRVAQERRIFRERLDNELLADHRRLLVVGEEISLLPRAAIGTMADALRGAGRDVRILAYLRDPLGYVTSAFQQQVRGGQSCFTLPRPHYRQRFEKFIDIYGANAVTFRPYTPAHFAGNSILPDYAAIAGLPAAALADRRDNPSMPLDAVRLLHLFNRTSPVARSIAEMSARSTLIRHLARNFGTPFALSPAIVSAVIDPEEVAWIESVSGISLDAGTEATPLPMSTMSPDPMLAEAALRLHMETIPPDAIAQLRATLALRRLPHCRHDDAATLLGTLYTHFLETAASQSGDRSRSA